MATEKEREYQRAWRARNRETINERNRQRRAADRERHNAYQREWSRKNADLRKEYRRRWQEKNPQFARLQHVKTRYGISVEDYVAMAESQQGLCAVCGLSETSLNKAGKVRILGVDHCHSTGQVRGLICHRCNFALSIVDEIPDWVERAAAYIRRTP